MKTSVVLVLSLILAVSSAAFAKPGGEGDNTDCNGVGNPNSPCEGNDNGGGNPNDPGTPTTPGDNFGIGIGIGGGAKVDNRNDNRNTNVNASNSSSSSKSSSSSNSSSSSSSNSISKSNSSATGGSATSNAQGGAGGTSNVNIDMSGPSEVRYSGSYKVKNTPDTYTYAPDPTSPCIVTYGAGGSGPGIGLSFSGGYKDDVCSALEIRRVASDNAQLVGKVDQYLNKEIDRLLGRADKGKDSATKVGGFGY